jgi:cyclophilin family peptidyl-prolyl cis-trans isomerase
LIAAKPAPLPQPKPRLSVVPPAEIAADPANRWTLELSNGGKVVVLLRPDVAPNTVYRIQQLTSQGFYDGVMFHRVIPGFMAQGGDPKGTGEGGSTLPDIAAEFTDYPHIRGVASMARSDDRNSANSQFFIMLAPTFSLDHDYTGFGRVIAGMQFVDAIAPGEPPAAPTKIVRAWLDGPMPVAVAAAPPPAPVQPQADTPATVATVPALAPAQPQAEAPAPAGQPAADQPKDSPATGG